MKPESLAKIAAQVSQFYEEAQNQMNQARIKGIWEKVRDHTWSLQDDPETCLEECS